MLQELYLTMTAALVIQLHEQVQSFGHQAAPSK